MATEMLTKPASTRRATTFMNRADPPPNTESTSTTVPLPKTPCSESGYLPQPIEYPDSDGQPMAESDFQRKPLAYAAEVLDIHYQDRPDVYVSGNIFVYLQEGDPREVVSPDVFVVFGAEKRDRRTYKLWEEPKAPDFILEITSRSSRTKDQGSKLGLYQFLGVTEYFCYDPTGDYLDPPLVGYRLEAGRYVPIPAKEVTPEKIIVSSSVLGLDLLAMDREFRFVDPITGEALRNFAEAESERIEERRLRLAEQQKRAEVESELLELRKKLAALETQKLD